MEGRARPGTLRAAEQSTARGVQRPAAAAGAAGAVLVAVALALVGCRAPGASVGPGESADSTAGVRPDPPFAVASTAAVWTDRASYVVQVRGGADLVDIIVTYANRTGGTVYVASCGGDPPAFTLEKRVGASWVATFSRPCVDVGYAPRALAAGDVYVDTLRVFAWSRTSGAEPALRTDLPGEYRGILDLLRTWNPGTGEPGLGERLPQDARTSNRFVLRE